MLVAPQASYTELQDLLGVLCRAQDDSNHQEEGLNARAHLKDLSGGLWHAITGEDLAKDTQAG